MATTANFVFEDGNGGAGLGVWEGIVVVRCVCVERGGAEKEQALLHWYSGCQQTRVIAGSL